MQANEPKGKATRSSATKPPESSSTVSMESDVVVVGHRWPRTAWITWWKYDIKLWTRCSSRCLITSTCHLVVSTRLLVTSTCHTLASACCLVVGSTSHRVISTCRLVVASRHCITSTCYLVVASRYKPPFWIPRRLWDRTNKLRKLKYPRAILAPARWMNYM